MNFIYKYYTCILGLIRFLGIGVGNEHARASVIFTFTLFAVINIIFRTLNIDIRRIGVFFILVFVLGLFFITYSLFSYKKSEYVINDWLNKTSFKEKIITASICLSFFIITTILFLKLYA